MAIVPRPSNTILLSPPHQVENQIENRYKTGVAATPGMFAEMYDNSGVLMWRPVTSATEYHTLAVYLENGMMNKGIDDDWAAGDLCRVAFLRNGDIINGLIPAAQDISFGEKLQPTVGGMAITAAATTATGNVAHLQSLDAPGAVAATTRVRMQVIG